MDFENAYQSIKNEFIDSEWWLIKKAHENQRLYRGLRTMTWCKDCATALAKHELEYKEVTDKSIFVKFKVRNTENEYLIVWTTTPWTIPFNMAVMVNPDLDYVRAKVGDEIWIMSKDLGPMVVQTVANKNYEELESFKGKKLEGLRYEHFFDKDMNYSSIKAKNPEKIHSVILSTEYVDTSAGTGLVHCAPGCGPEDYEIGHRNGIPPFNTLDEKGVFPESSGRFNGLTAKKDDGKFIDFIDKEAALIATSDIEHDYAHCWRCNNGVIYRTTKQWFFRVEDIKEQMIKENNKIRWVPQTAYNAFNSWLENLRDNSISKQRFWGTPLPIWVNEKDQKDYIVIGSIKELEELSGMKVDDPHIPRIDNVIIKREGKTYRRVPDILDVWVDAGTVSWNCLDYPKRTDLFNELFPAEFILEGKDQIRGWFNLLHVASMISMNKPSFKNVYMHGFVQDSAGRKMSKSLGNYILPEEVIGKYGADTFRFYFIGGANPGQDINYNPEDVELKHKNLNVLWNLHNFIIDFLKNNEISAKDLKIDYEKLDIEEKYMLSFMSNKIRQASLAFDEYKLNIVPLLIEELFLELSRCYIQLVREKSVQGSEEDKKKIACVLSECMMSILKMFSTICPFICEAMYQDIKPLISSDEDSIHECLWPQYNAKIIDDILENDMENINAVIQGILFAREKSQLGVRWPVKAVYVITKKEETIASVKRLMTLIEKQVNARNIIIKESLPGIKVTFKPDYGRIGKSFGNRTHEIINKLSKENQDKVVAEIEEKNKFIIKLGEQEFGILKEHLVLERKAPSHLQEAEFRDGLVYIDKTRTPELEAEGFTREIIRRVQSLRKKEGMNKTEKIELFLKVPGQMVNAVGELEQQIKIVTGSTGIMIDSNEPDKEYKASSKEKIKDSDIWIFFNKTG